MTTPEPADHADTLDARLDLAARLTPPPDITTLGRLREAGWTSIPVAEEIRRNASARIAAGQPLVTGVLGFEDTVLPQLENAVLAGHDVILLGERGQAKTRIIRSMVGLLDEWLPIVAHSEINDDPYHPISRFAKDLLAEAGDDLPVSWVHRSDRYGEKLATPDTSIADLIGEVDPIRVAEGRYLSDELTIHYGLVPRLNRGIFAVNELPDLAERIQVGLLNVLEERDVQIRGHRVRLPLDIVLVATANPEDYTNRGRIITPLKDRFGAQIRTHYPPDAATELRIAELEADLPGRTGSGGGAGDGRGAAGRGARLHGRGGGRAEPAGPREPPPQPALRRVGPPDHRQLRDAGGQRHPPGPAQRRGRGRAPGVATSRPWSPRPRARSRSSPWRRGARRSCSPSWSRPPSCWSSAAGCRSPSPMPWSGAFTDETVVHAGDDLPAAAYADTLAQMPALSAPVLALTGGSEDPGVVASAVEFLLEGLHLTKRLNKEAAGARAIYRGRG